LPMAKLGDVIKVSWISWPAEFLPEGGVRVAVPRPWVSKTPAGGVFMAFLLAARPVGRADVSGWDLFSAPTNFVLGSENDDVFLSGPTNLVSTDLIFGSDKDDVFLSGPTNLFFGSDNCLSSGPIDLVFGSDKWSLSGPTDLVFGSDDVCLSGPTNLVSTDLGFGSDKVV
jgi:hypothetical protein